MVNKCNLISGFLCYNCILLLRKRRTRLKMMKKSIGILLALAGFAVVGGILGENDKGNAMVFRTFNEPPRIQKALSGATTTQPTDIYPDDGNATFPISQIYVSGNANEGKPTSLYASGRPLLITEGTIAGATTLYSNGST